MMTDSSELWEHLTLREFSAIDDDFLNRFRSPGSANKFVAWDPYERSARYFKFLLFTVTQRQSTDFFDAYKRIGNCNIGSPLSIRYSDCDINADYLAAVEEWAFLSASGGLADVRSVVEIGAGFGRTCHTIMSLSPWIEEYTIIDLDAMLQLSQSYLKAVVPQLLGRIRFVSSDDSLAQKATTPDVVINIDSFQEMPTSTINGYMERVIWKARRFYCKNPVGKYLPVTVGMPELAPEQLMDVFSLGYCRSVIDVFDERALEEARAVYLEAYRPRPDHGMFNVAAAKIMGLFPYFHHALYVRA